MHQELDGGILKPIELHGPPNVRSWTESYRLLMIGLIGFGAVSLGPLLDYLQKITDYERLYGQGASHLHGEPGFEALIERLPKQASPVRGGRARASQLVVA